MLYLCKSVSNISCQPISLAFYFMCTCVFLACMSVHHLYPQRPEKVIRSTGTGTIAGYELLCVCSELNQGSLQELQVLLTTEPPLQSSRGMLDTESSGISTSTLNQSHLSFPSSLI